MRVVVCDDEPNVCNYLREMLEEYGSLKHMTLPVKVCTTGEELLAEIAESGFYDIILLDIRLISTNGISVARQIKDIYPISKIIFISSYSEYYREAFDVQPFHFLDKPIQKEFLFKVLDKAINSLASYPEAFTFSIKRTIYNIKLNEIIFFESDRRQIRIICRAHEYEFYGKISDVERMLSLYQSRVFLKIHRSFLVNVNYIKSIGPDYLIMANDKRLGVSVDRKREVRDFYLNWIRSMGEVMD